jgi:hypothetical protein
MITMNELRNYGRHLGIRGLWRKNKNQLQDHLFNAVHDEINDRMLRRTGMDPDRAFMEAELSLQAKKGTNQKTWKTVETTAREAGIPFNRRRATKEGIEHELTKKNDALSLKYRQNRMKKDRFTTPKE